MTSDGWFKTDTSFEFLISAFEVEVREVRVEGAGTEDTATQGTCTFDPAHPPAGCTLCHGGHCHCGNELKSYEELEAQVCGAAGSSTTTLATLPVGTVFDLRPDQAEKASAELAECTPSCELGRGSVGGVTVVAERLRLEATLRDQSIADRLQGATRSVMLDLPLGGLALKGHPDVATTLDRDQPYGLYLRIRWPVAAGLLDGIAWETLEREGDTIRVDGAHNGDAFALLVEKVGLSVPEVTVERPK